MDYKYIEHELGDVLTEIFSGGTPNTQKKDYWNGDLHWLSSGETRNRIIKETEKSITELGAQNSSTKLAKGGDIVMASAGQGFTRGQTSIIEIDTYINQSLIALRGNPQIIDNKYLFYNLSSRYQELRMLSDSSSIRGSITTKMLKKMKIMLPNIEKQKSVSSFLWDLDKKIDINKAIINNLDQLSQTLFKHWFIDFEFPNEEGKPYKTSGGEMVESELGEIPKGWCVSEIDNLGTIIGGGTPSKKYDEYYTNNGISWITPKDLSNDKNTFIYKGAIDITELGLKKSSARILQKDTVLFSSRAPIGYIAIAGKEVTTNQGFKSIVPDKGYSSYFIYHLLKFKLPMIEAAAGGSTFKEVSGKGLKEIPVTLPTVELVNIYKEIVEPLFLQIQTLEKENQNLQQLRDTLLPKLLSGEIEIPDNLEV